MKQIQLLECLFVSFFFLGLDFRPDVWSLPKLPALFAVDSYVGRVFYQEDFETTHAVPLRRIGNYMFVIGL